MLVGHRVPAEPVNFESSLLGLCCSKVHPITSSSWCCVSLVMQEVDIDVEVLDIFEDQLLQSTLEVHPPSSVEAIAHENVSLMVSSIGQSSSICQVTVIKRSCTFMGVPIQLTPFIMPGIQRYSHILSYYFLCRVNSERTTYSIQKTRPILDSALP